MLTDDTGLGFRIQLNNEFALVDSQISDLNQQIQDLNLLGCASMYSQTITGMSKDSSIDLDVPISQGAVINIFEVLPVGEDLVTQIATLGGSSQDFTLVKKSDTQITVTKNSEGTNNVIVYSTY